jgi:hypothetical protein
MRGTITGEYFFINLFYNILSPVYVFQTNVRRGRNSMEEQLNEDFLKKLLVPLIYK